MISLLPRTRTLSMVKVALHHVAGPQRAAIVEALVAVHDPPQRQLQLRVGEHHLPGRCGDHRGEGRRRDRSLAR